jgi:hypothetical protein
MARQRSNPETHTEPQTKGNTMSLDLNEINEILAGTRSRTNAGAYVSEFVASGDLGREVDLTSGTFAGKDAKKVKTALDNARKKMTDDGKLVIPEGPQIAVRVKDGKVFLINTALVAQAQAAAAA